MSNVCNFRWRVHEDGLSDRAVADYLAGYGEALADEDGRE